MSEKAIVYYTDNRLDAALGDYCRNQLRRRAGNIPIICISQEPMAFGEFPFCVGKIGRSSASIFMQIMSGAHLAKNMNIPWLFLAEHDVLYPPGYFDYTPPGPGIVCYQRHVYNVNDRGFWRADRPLMSGLCCDSETLEAAMRQRYENTRAGQRFSRSEPGTLLEDPYPMLTYHLARPMLDIRHGNNFTGGRASRDGYQSTLEYWGPHAELWRRLGLKGDDHDGTV